MNEPSFVDYLNGVGRSGGAFVTERTGLRIYVRRSLRAKGAYDLANVAVPEDRQKQGIFTRFLIEYANIPLRIENVNNTILEKWLLRHSEWTVEDSDWIGLSASYLNKAFVNAYRKELVE